MGYDNTGYWVDVHRRVEGLRAVGWPTLSEEFNGLKYQSECASIRAVFEHVAEECRADGKEAIRILELGAGVGYWLDVAEAFFERAGFRVELTALDISQEALDKLKARKPKIEVVQRDLKSADPGNLPGEFDLVLALAVLHHLPTTTVHINGLRFAARKVAPGGHFVLMDPILTRAYSQFDVFDFSTFKGNGVPRHLYFIDDILAEEALRRVEFVPAISFLLNSNIEADAILRSIPCRAAFVGAAASLRLPRRPTNEVTCSGDLAGGCASEATGRSP